MDRPFRASFVFRPDTQGVALRPQGVALGYLRARLWRSNFPPQRGKPRQPRATPWDYDHPPNPSPERAAQRMKLETFFEKFDQFADAPDAVAKMRELVLELAVHGKVADQDARDEPAAKLLQRLVAYKLANPLSGRSGRSKEEPVENEPNSEYMPANWVNTTIGEVLYVIRGASPRPKGDPQYFSETRTPYHWVKISDIRKHGQNGLLMDTDEFLTEAGMRKSVLLPKGTLVLTNSATIGVPIVLGIEGCCIHDGYLAFPNFPHGLLSQKFLLYLFHTLKKHAERNARGLAQLNLNTELVRSFPFGLPPLAEQKRIVAKVDELMALCDRLALQQQERETRHAALARASLARFADAPTPANLHFLFHPSYAIPPADLRKSILTLAVQGKLVPQDPNDEPADELFERIQAERAEQEAKGAYKSSRPLEPIEETEEPFKLPVEWKWARLRSLVFTLGDGLHGTPEYSDGTDCYFINGNNLVDGRIVIKPQTKTVSLDEAKKHRKPMTLSTVLVSINGTLGSVAFYNNENVILGKSACYFNLASLVDKHFARRVIESPYFVNYASENATGTTIRNLGLKAMNYFPFTLPPLAEQRRIVAKVEQLMTLVDALETQLAASRATAANLLSALVAELTGTPRNGKVSVPSTSTTGRRGRPPKS